MNLNGKRKFQHQVFFVIFNLLDSEFVVTTSGIQCLRQQYSSTRLIRSSEPFDILFARLLEALPDCSYNTYTSEH